MLQRVTRTNNGKVCLSVSNAGLSYYVIFKIAGLGIIGAIILILFGLFAGLAPGFMGTKPIILYLLYHDPILLMYVAITAQVADILDALRNRNKGE